MTRLLYNIVSYFIVLLILTSCVKKLEEETSATRAQVELSVQRMTELEKSQGLFGAITAMNNNNDTNMSSRARFALMLFKQGNIKDSDSPNGADDQIYFHIGAPAPIRLAMNPNLGLRNVTIINPTPNKAAPKNENVRSVNETIHAVQALAIKQWLEKLFYASTSNENYDDNREEAYRAIVIGKSVLGAALGKEMAKDSAYREQGVKAFYQEREDRIVYANYMKAIRNNYKLWDRINDALFRAYLTTMGAEGVLP